MPYVFDRSCITPSTKVLTVRQPYAFAISDCGKDVENRLYPTGYRGVVLIHAAKEPYEFPPPPELYEIMEEHGWCFEHPGHDVRGAIIAAAELYDCVKADPMRRDSLWEARDYSGYYWRFRDVAKLRRPVPARGQLGLWRLGPELWGEIDRVGFEE